MIFDIERNSYVDGPGIRTTVFFKGCNLKCAWCHNPESQSFEPQMMFYRELCTGCGKCEKVCPVGMKDCTLCGRCALFCPADARRVCGKEYAAEEILDEILKDRSYFENSGGGVTFSGGECMLQPELLLTLLQKCKEQGIQTAVDTAGHLPFEAFERVLPFTDLFLYDLKIFDCEKHKEYIGVGNQLILDNLKRLFAVGARVWVRIPVIAGVNDSAEEMEEIRSFLRQWGPPEKVELLPYHAMGENKYPAIGKEGRCFTPPTQEKMNQLKQIFG